MLFKETNLNTAGKIFITVTSLLFLMGLIYLGTQSVLAEEVIQPSIDEGMTDVAPSCSETLPRVEYLGEGAGDYVLADGYDVFIVKQRQPFKFLLVDGTVNDGGQTVYTAPRDDDRVWVCAGNCNIPSIYHDAYDLGQLTPGWVVNLLVIDDDGLEQNNDQRRNWWAADNPKNPYLIVEDQQMVEYLSLEIPFEAQWYYYAEDSIGIVTTCIEPVTPTPTPTNTPTDVPPTVTPTAVGTESPTPTPPVQTPPVGTPTVETPTTGTPTSSPESPVETPATGTPAIETPVPGTGTPGGQSTPGIETSTPVATVTPTVPLQPTSEVPTPTPFVAPPTAIDLLSFTAVRDGDGIVIRWSTSYEESTFGYRLYRSVDGTRDSAVLVTDQLIASQGTLGGDYMVTDVDVRSGVAYTYWLEEVEIDGSVSAVAFVTIDTLTEQIFLPYTTRP